jgi:hypothetical protein
MNNKNGYNNCNTCNKNFKSYKSLWNHRKIFHSNIILNVDQETTIVVINKKLQCKFCFVNFKSQSNKCQHEKNYCKEKNKINDIIKANSELEIKKIELEKIKEEKLKLKEEKYKLKEEKEILKLKNIQENSNKLDKNMEKYDVMKSIVSDLKLQIKILEENQKLAMNNQLLNVIAEKNNTIEEFNNKFQAYTENKELVIINQEITQIKSLTFNGVVIVSRSDGYIDATEICKAGGKLFAHWYSLESTKKLLYEAASDIGIPISQLLDIKKGNSINFNQGSWIHPDLAIQLAQWISPSFALQVSKWIRTLFTDGNVSINIKLQNELKISNNKIKLLEDTYLRKHKRDDYPEINVIYMVTTEANKNKRNYIIGKTTNLKNRLSNYNKTTEHEVIYYKSCKNESSMNIVESIILNKLDKYREKANRDRFILPLEKDITLFTDIIDESINFLN